MIFVFIVFGISLMFGITQSYVLLQVRKQNDNFSNVDALIHKVVPSSKLNELTQSIARKQFYDKKGDTELTYVSDLDDGTNPYRVVHKETRDGDSTNIMDVLRLLFRKFTSSVGPYLRSQIQNNVTELLKSGNSTVLTIDSRIIVHALKEVLSSKTFRKYLDNISKKAAFVYRAVQDELHNE